MLDFLSIKDPINVSVLEEDQDLQAYNNLDDNENTVNSNGQSMEVNQVERQYC